MIAREEVVALTETAATATATAPPAAVSWSFPSPTATAATQHPAPSTSSAAGMIVVPGSGMDVVQRYEYTGRELASGSGEYYFRFRVYGPDLGQFFTRDPLGYEDGMGLYGGWFAERLSRDEWGLTGYGGTKCLFSPSSVEITVPQNICNLMPCSLTHERIHAIQIKTCCALAGVAYQLATLSGNTTAQKGVRTTFDTWITANTSFMECQAHTASFYCSLNIYRNLSKGGCCTAACCTTVGDYVLASNQQRTKYCAASGTTTGLTPCPFPTPSYGPVPDIPTTLHP